MESKRTSPFEERAGRLYYRPDRCSADFWATWSFADRLYGEEVVVDHVVVLQVNRERFERFNGELLVVGGQFTEGPAPFPAGFCTSSDNTELPLDLWFYMAGVSFPQGIVVVLAPYRDGDQHARLLQEQGSGCVPHVALRVPAGRMDESARSWQQRGFIPLTREPVDDGQLYQWFLGNSAGQIIELIERRSGDATFSCHNIHKLRQAEAAPEAAGTSRHL